MDRDERSSADPRMTSLLVVEDDAQVRRMLVRLMVRHFDAVFEADSVQSAESVLASRRVTHLFLDYHLGGEMPHATGMLARWREIYPDIGRVVLLTGARISAIDVPKEVDLCISKGEDPIRIMALLTG